MPSETPHHQFLNALNVLLKNPSELHHYLSFPREGLLNTQSLTRSGMVPVSEKPATWQLAFQADGTAARVGVLAEQMHWATVHSLGSPRYVPVLCTVHALSGCIYSK